MGGKFSPLPLWKLKITDDEYEELKRQLRQLVVRNNANCDNPFICRARESVLFYAEYWRREYYEGAHSKQSVYDALGCQFYNPDNYEHLYQSAIRGAKRLKIELYSDEGRTQWLDSMFYQGGLPMKLVTDGKPNSIWDNFVRGLVNRNVNFEDLNLGIVASNSNSLKDFCDQIITALDARQFMLMPFHCDNELDSWYAFLQELKEEESRRHRGSRPFSLDWKFRIDAVEKIVYIKFVVNGCQRLPQAFTEENEVSNRRFFSVQINVNGKDVDTFDYSRNFCRYKVISEHTYHVGDFISVNVDDSATPIMAEDLDMSVPHLLYKNNEGKYELGNRIGRQDSFLFIPKGWDVEDIQGLRVDQYKWEETAYDGIMIPADFEGDVTVKSRDGIMTFSCNAVLYWTELSSMPVYTPNIVEPLYDASRTHFSLCNDMENGVMKNRNARVEYRSKWDNEWKTEPGYGEIFARTIDGNGHFVTPVKFINIGNGVAVNVVSADAQTCKIQVVWEHGRVSTTDGVKRVNDVWEINKADISGNKIRFTLIPEDNSNNQFDIHVKAPFKEFAILDTDEKAISSDCWIPYSDIHNYQYHLIGQGLQYTYGEHRRQQKWMYITKDGKIPYEGSLLSLLGSREELRQLLDRTSQDMLHAEVNVRIQAQDGNELSFAVKDFPYRVDQLEDGKIVIKSKDKKIIDYRGDLKLFKLDDPSVEPERLTYDEEVGYRLPEAIRPWGKTLLVGRARGRICPRLVDLTQELTKEKRREIRENTIKQINEGLETSSLGDELWRRIIGWFRRTQEDDIPASSLLGLYCVAQSPNALMCFAFQLFAQCDDEEDCETLVEQLKSFSADLSFSWYWLYPYLNSALNTINGYIRDVNDDRYINLAMQQGDNSFDAWMKKLCVASLVETYDCETNELVASVADKIVYHPNELFDIDDKDYDYIDINQAPLSENASKFFDKYQERGQKGNEAWMWKRVNAVQAHLNRQVDLFTETEEIRRSVIFCQKSCNKQFVISLNNKLRN